MLVGYMRVSSEHDRQTTDLQHDALIDAGVDPRHLLVLSQSSIFGAKSKNRVSGIQ